MATQVSAPLLSTSHSFLTEDFLLESEAARRLYHGFAVQQPIIDYHNHLNPEHIATNYHFRDITELWLDGDHYKWRALRANGVAENDITGGASARDKFKRWAATVPATMMNPLYHWTHMELWRSFGITETLSAENADAIFDELNAQLTDRGARDLLIQSHVTHLCTTDDPVDNLDWHELQSAQEGPKMYPTFRADKTVNVELPGFQEYIRKLGIASNIQIGSLEDLFSALESRHAYFAQQGCRLSDHGLDRFYFATATQHEVDQVFQKALAGNSLSPLEIEQYKTALLLQLARMDARAGWVQQFHVGAIRNNNGRLKRLLGADAGCDSIGDLPTAEPMSRFFDALDQEGMLAKTIVYNLHPANNDLFAAMIGNFNDGAVPGKMQYGAAWWFLDQIEGMEAQLKTISNYSLLSRFVGMLTDSRSFLSFSRHEYFRRILCNFLGDAMTKGKLPNDEHRIGQLVEDICYKNAQRYFGFE